MLNIENSPILVSWISYNSDFHNGSINRNTSPNFLFHKHFYSHKKHVLLSPEAEEGVKGLHALQGLKKDFPSHEIELRYLNISDVIDLNEVKTKIESVLLSFYDEPIDIFFSPGTSIMQLAWYICHIHLNLSTRILQSRPAQFSKNNEIELVELNIHFSKAPFTAILKEQLLYDSNKKGNESPTQIITPSIKSVYQKAHLVAQTDHVHVLISGESGTGKEFLATYIHQQSVRKNKAYIAVNCSAFHDSLLESRLFGHVKGAFTDAICDANGLFKQAEGGTLFLDEIGDISPYMQQLLLRVIQEKEMIPVGGKPQKINVRIIAATNKNLSNLAEKGLFRWDLYYRLAVVELQLPTFKSRGMREINTMLDYFLKVKQKQFRRKQVLKINNEVRQALLSYHYPGNIRELENIIDTLYVFANELACIDDLPESIKKNANKDILSWQAVEKEHIRFVLDYYHGNKNKACTALGYGSINTLRKKISDYELL